MAVNEGLNDSERYLSGLCKRTFLSLWSFTNVFRQPGTELTDLLVVCGNDIIIFSDKLCEYPVTSDKQLNWNRWFRRAIKDSAKQLWGAENWIKRSPERVFLDSICQLPMPVPITITPDTKFHLILVAHGALTACQEELGGSGSLHFSNEIKGFSQHSTPFIIGDIDSNRTFIHVIDDNTLDILLQNRDTISDFKQYLTKREAFLRSGKVVSYEGEEELLTYYLKMTNDEGEHDFVFPQNPTATHFVMEAGGWDEFQINPQRLAQLNADQDSYFWDDLIERFSVHAINGTQYHVTEGGYSDSERAIRMMALENRFYRRVLANSFLEILQTTPADRRMLRVAPMMHDRVYYIFLLMPFPRNVPNITYDDYRFVRREFLESACYIVRLMLPDAEHVVGIAMESGMTPYASSEDLIYFDCSGWDDELETFAREEQQRLGILVKPRYFEKNVKEYPDFDR